MLDKYNLLYLKPNKVNFISYFLIIVLICVVLILAFYQKHDVIKLQGIVVDNNVELNVSLDKINALENSDFLIVNEQRRELKILSISELEIDYLTMQSYQKVLLEINDIQLIKNQVIDVFVYKNKESILWKISKKIIGKE